MFEVTLSYISGTLRVTTVMTKLLKVCVTVPES